MSVDELARVAAPIALTAFALLLVLQWRYPLRPATAPELRRVVMNLLAGAPGILVSQLAVLPIGLATIAWTTRNHFGLIEWLRLWWPATPFWLEAALGFLLLDLTFYYWHRLNHTIPLLWRFHNFHHVDPEMDVSTAWRFHFGEMALSSLFRVVQLGLAGISFPVYWIFEVCFAVEVQFHHSNWRLPFPVEQALNRILVTPRMHELHHSIVHRETDSNYSSVFSWWDRLNGSFTASRPDRKVTIGVPAYRDPSEHSLGKLWLLPFVKQRDYWRAEL